MTPMWYHLVKVPLIVSPHPPSFPLQPRVCPRALPTFLDLCFGASLVSQFACPLFSWSYELLLPQPLYFDNHLRCPRGVGSAPSFQLCVLCASAVKTSLTPLPATHPESALVTPFSATHTKKQGWGQSWLTTIVPIRPPEPPNF